MKHLLGIPFLALCLLTLSAGGAVAQEKVVQEEVVDIQKKKNSIKVTKYPFNQKYAKQDYEYHQMRENILSEVSDDDIRELLFSKRYWFGYMELPVRYRDGVLDVDRLYFDDEDNWGYNYPLGDTLYTLIFEFDENREHCLVHIFEEWHGALNIKQYYYTTERYFGGFTVLAYDGEKLMLTYEWKKLVSAFSSWTCYPTTKKELNEYILLYNKYYHSIFCNDIQLAIDRDKELKNQIVAKNLTLQPIGKAELVAVKKRKIKKIVTQ